MAEVDEMQDFVQIWECDAPDLGAAFQVLEDEWSYPEGEKPVRVIKRVRLLKVG